MRASRGAGHLRTRRMVPKELAGEVKWGSSTSRRTLRRTHPTELRRAHSTRTAFEGRPNRLLAAWWTGRAF